MPQPDRATAQTIGHFYLMVRSHGASFWVSREYTKRNKREMLVLSQTALFAEAFTMEELPKIITSIRVQFKGADILPLECDTRKLVSAIMRKTINV